ncbi:MAG: phospholipase D-like domain-containing protein, partial [Candidatus Promineifilaceae bacterium]
SSLMHNKFMVIDGQYVWTGSTNLTDNGLTLNHNNSLLFDAINVATIFTIEFEEMFESGLPIVSI